VADYLGKHAIVQRLVDDLIQFMERWLPELAHTNRSYLTIAIGCTGGQHRSVYLVERLAAHFRNLYPQVLTRHQVVGKIKP
jgi:UPF0042 nucleotide-binding protein